MHELMAKFRTYYYALIILIILIFAYSTVYRVAWNDIQRTDFTVYTEAGKAILYQLDLYHVQNIRGWRYVYLPPFAIWMVPFSLMPLALGAFIWYVLEITAIYFSLVFSIRMLGIETKENTRFLYFALPLLSLCVLLLSGIMRCQASEFVIFFSIATFYYSQRNRIVLSAISLAFATLIKVFPASLILYFIFKKKWNYAFAFGVALLILGLLLPSLQIGFHTTLNDYMNWFHVVGSKAVESNVDRQSNTDLYQQLLDTTKSRNQSFEALFLTLSVPAAWVNYFVASIALFSLISMYRFSMRIQSQLDQIRLISAFLIWSLLITPIAESHYFGVLILPLLTLSYMILTSQLPVVQQRKLITWGVLICVGCMILISFPVTEKLRPLCWLSMAMWYVLIYGFKNPDLIAETSYSQDRLYENEV